MLGITIGVGAVICVVAIGEGAQATIDGDERHAAGRYARAGRVRQSERNTMVRGVGPEYLALKSWRIVRGGMYTESDVQ